MRRWRGMPALLALLLILAVAATVRAADQDVLLPVDEDELLILEVRAERYLASSGLVGYRHGDQVLLPLGELAAVLEYAILSYPDRGRVEGWLVDESRTFALDVESRRVDLAGRQLGIDEPCLYVNADDVYVDSEVLARWWPIDVEVDLRGLRVLVTPREPVPLVARLEREAMWARLGRDEGREPAFPRHEAGYRMAAWPFLEATVAADHDRDDTRWSGSLLSRGDLARLSVTGFLSYDRSATNDWTAWLRAGRDDRDGDLLGPLGATSFAAGDVVSTALPLIGGSQRGRGVMATNRPLGSVSQFDAIDVVGDAPPGWQVELYLDGSLHDIQTVGADGGYTFAAVPLHLGLNTIRAVIYGPNGQQREQVRTYNIRSGMWRRGHLHYDYSSLQFGKSIVGSRVSGSNLEGEGEWLHRLTLGYGLGPTTTLSGAFAREYVDEATHDYAQVQLLQSLGPVFMQAVGVKDLDQGQAGSLSAQTRLGRQSLLLSFSQFDDFVSNTNEGSGELARRAEARLSGALTRSGRSLLHYRLKWQGDDYIDDIDLRRNFYSAYVGAGLGRFNLSHELRHQQDSGAVSRHDTQGQFLLSGYLGGVRVLGDMMYDISGDDGVESAGVTFARQLSPRLSSQITGRRSFLGDGFTNVLANLDWQLRPVQLGLRAGYDTQNSYSIGVQATTSLVRAPDSGGWLMSGRKLTNHGAALVQAFIDRDHDGAYGSGDDALAGVGFGRNALWQDIRTAEDGLAFLPGLPANQFVNVKVDYGTVEDPYLVPSHEGMTTVVHPGGVSNLAFPFHYVGEIEGLVARDSALTRPLRNIGLELLSQDGRRVATAVSEFDGFYLFQDVLPGDYLVGVVETTLRGQPYLVPAPQPVSVPAGGDYVQGPAIILRLPGDTAPVVVVAREDEPDPELEPVAAAGDGAADGRGSGDGAAGGRGDGEPLVADAGERTAPGRDVARAGTDAGDGGDEAADERVIASADRPAPGVTDGAPPASTPATSTTVATSPTPAAAPAATVDPATLRTLHLIYELLYDSEMFSGTRR